MKIFKVLSFALLAMLCAGVAGAQVTTQLEGNVIGPDGKTPYPKVVLIAKNSAGGHELETTSNSQGKFTFNKISPGTYIISVKVMDREVRDYNQYASGTMELASPVVVKEKLKEVIQLQVKVVPGRNEPIVINFKEMLAKGAAAAALRKKREEETKNFEGFKGHFEAGREQLDQALSAKEEMKKLPPSERGPLTEKVTQTSQSAISELEAAKTATTETDSNMHVVMYSLGEAYEITGRDDEAIDAYAKAIALKSDVPGYYQALSTAQARTGKMTEAMATCEKSSKLPLPPGTTDSAQAISICYGNVAILLQNASKMRESVELLKKATEVNPNNAEYWFLLARGLTSAMDSKMEGGKMIAIVQPGTVEAYQKYLELAPTGRFAQKAKDSLEMLKSLGVGIDTKVNTRKKKP